MDVTEFVTAKARAATHPIFGKITQLALSKTSKRKTKENGILVLQLRNTA